MMLMKYVKKCIALCTIVLCFSIVVKAQEGRQITVTSTVHDEKGRPVSGVLVSGDAGKITAYTDQSGRFSITVPANSVVLINAKGYKMQTLRAGSIPARISIAAEIGGQEVYLPFAMIDKQDLPGAISV